jgi:hypothetical protein
VELKQEMADVEAAIDQLKAQQPAAAPPAPAAGAEKVTMRHPQTQDTQVVDAAPNQIIPLMLQGYRQVKQAVK